MSSETVTTVAFADFERDLYGFASSAGLAVLFRGRDLVEVGSGSDLALTMGLDAPSSRWSVEWEGSDCGFEVVGSAVAAPVDGPNGSEWLVHVEGTVRIGERTIEISAPGQVGSSSTAPGSMPVRSVGAWFEDGGIVLESAGEHGGENVWAALVEDGEPVIVVDPRLSTTYDGDGHQRRAGLELWMTEEGGYPVRAAGEVICGSSLDLDDGVLDLAFFRWRSGGAEGVGRYDILRRP